MDQQQKKPLNHSCNTVEAACCKADIRSVPNKSIDGIFLHTIPSRPAMRYDNVASRPCRPQPGLSRTAQATSPAAEDDHASQASDNIAVDTIGRVPQENRSRQATPSAIRQPRRSSVLHRPMVQKPRQTDLYVKTQKENAKKINMSHLGRRSVFRLRFVLSGVGIAAAFALLGGVAAFMVNDNDQQAETEKVLASKSEMPARVEAPEQGHVIEEPITAEEMESHRVPRGLPEAISIDAIDLNARIQKTTVNMDNRIQLPKNIFDVGWYEGSRKPGEKGVVLLNSYVSGANERGAFYYLRALEPGDIIELETGGSKRYKYEVRHKEYFPYNEMKTVSLLVPYESGENGLNLVAVDDRFNVMNNEFQDRLVVYAVQL